MHPTLLELSSITKRFGPTLALDNVSLSLSSGQVLALIGENGAGKSTLLKVLSGAHAADSGEILLDGSKYLPTGNAHQARQAGVAMIYQELNLAADLSVEDNIMLGQPGQSGGRLLRSRQRPAVCRALAAVGLSHIAPQTIVGKLSVAHQQLIEVARALVSKAKVLLLDEPTSSLPADDAKRLFEIIRHLKSQGLGIVYISHFLEEIRLVADRYCVLRDGRHVGQGQIADVTDREIVSMMVGRQVSELYPTSPHQPGEVVVRLRGLSGVKQPSLVDLDLQLGEIFGLAGLVGAGRTEFLRTLMGLDHQSAGEVQVLGYSLPASLGHRMKRGLGMLSEDRKREGLAQKLSIIENTTLSRMTDYTRLGLLNLRQRRLQVGKLLQQLQVKCRDGDQPVSQLSGGNQQKVAIARILHQQSTILLLDEPTKGIDVGTKAEIYKLMGSLAAQGRTLIFVSSYLPELLAICDRIGVMSRGRLIAAKPADQWSEESIMHCAVSGESN